MTRECLIEKLKSHKVNENDYDFGNGHGYYDDQYLLNEVDSFWVIYYLERGVKHELRRFKDEGAANDYFFYLMIFRNCTKVDQYLGIK